MTWPLAYRGYKVRLREALVLTRCAFEASSRGDSVMASAASKGAVVLGAAALERFLADALDAYADATMPSKWKDLTVIARQRLLRQVARRLGARASVVWKRGDMGERAEKSLRRVLRESRNAMRDPSTWTDRKVFGILGDRPELEPARLVAVLEATHVGGVLVSEHFARVGVERGKLLGSLEQLVRSRHGAAHALANVTAPGPTDVAAWLRSAFRLTRQVAAYLDVPTPKM